jgi:hypothetical protein
MLVGAFLNIIFQFLIKIVLRALLGFFILMGIIYLLEYPGELYSTWCCMEGAAIRELDAATISYICCSRYSVAALTPVAAPVATSAPWISSSTLLAITRIVLGSIVLASIIVLEGGPEFYEWIPTGGFPLYVQLWPQDVPLPPGDSLSGVIFPRVSRLRATLVEESTLTMGRDVISHISDDIFYSCDEWIGTEV